MSVLCEDVGCWALESCDAVQLCSPRRVSIYLLHAYKQWEEDICCSSSTTPLNSFHPILLSISSFGGKQRATSGSIPGFIQVEMSIALVAVSIP